MPLTPGRLTSKIRQLGPSSGFLSRNFSAVSKPSELKPTDFSRPCIDARMLASSSTTNTVAEFADAIAISIVNALAPNEEMIPVRDLDPGAVNLEQRELAIPICWSFPGCASADTGELPHLYIVVSILLPARDWLKF